ncbi:MAG: glycosyltransferase family 4 protein [Candidatus Krumholzibacteriia bacterium]
MPRRRREPGDDEVAALRTAGERGVTVRVALCSVGELFGGVERQILDLCRYLQRTGLQRTGADLAAVVLFHDGELARQLRGRGVEPCIVTAAGRYDPRLAQRVAGVLAREGVDVVHAHGYKATIACALARRTHRFGLVVTVHGRPEATLAHPVNWLKARLNHRLERWAVRQGVDALAYVTHDIAAGSDRSHRDVERHVIPNGIDPLDATARERPAELTAGAFDVGIVGRVSPVKGIGFALDALGRPEVPQSVRLHVIGTGSMTRELQERARRAGLDGRVVFHGFRADILDYLAHLDALLMPSFHEGLPYTLLEAMALGRPVIASRVGGLAEVLRHDETGLLVEVGDVAGIAGALARLAGDPGLVRRLGEAARREQRARYTLDAMGKAYDDLYARHAPSPAAMETRSR